MWSSNNKVWLHYQKDIIASDVYAAVFLSAYLRHATIQKLYSWQMEIIDLQHYKLIKHPKKVASAIRERSNESFVFIVGKN